MRHPTPDIVAARELVLYAINHSSLYYSRTLPIARNLARKQRAGTYDAGLAIIAWNYLANAAAKAYATEYGSGRVGATFTPSTRLAAAEALRDYYSDFVENLADQLPTPRKRRATRPYTTPAT